MLIIIGGSNLKFEHIPVLLKECLKGLNIKDNGLYLDGTLGGAGHSQAILDSSNCKIVAFDLDIVALQNAEKKLQKYKDRIKLVHCDFANAKNILDELDIPQIDGVLLDLGVSSYQLDTPERGFSYMHNGLLDMRMNNTDGLTAHDIINTFSKENIVKILRDYGEENFASRIASNIVKEREKKPINTTLELVQIIKNSKPFAKNGHPAKKVFMALRIAVNNELDKLDRAVRNITDKIATGGNICIITFHSLEDRLVKHTLKDLASGCICDKRLPLCVCGIVPKIRLLDKIRPSKQELNDNKRAKSATLRIATKL